MTKEKKKKKKKPLAICTAAKPTPPAAAVTKTHSPVQLGSLNLLSVICSTSCATHLAPALPFQRDPHNLLAK